MAGVAQAGPGSSFTGKGAILGAPNAQQGVDHLFSSQMGLIPHPPASHPALIRYDPSWKDSTRVGGSLEPGKTHMINTKPIS